MTAKMWSCEMKYFGAPHLHSSLTLTHQIDSYLAHWFNAFRSTHGSFPIYVQKFIEALIMVALTTSCWLHKHTRSQQRSQSLHPTLNSNSLLSINSYKKGSTNLDNRRHPSGIILYLLLYTIALCFVVTDRRGNHGNVRRLGFRTITWLLSLIGHYINY